MNYKHIDSTLHKLMEINWEVKKKKEEIRGAKKFNRLTRLPNQFDLKELNEELQQLEIEYNVEKRNL